MISLPMTCEMIVFASPAGGINAKGVPASSCSELMHQLSVRSNRSSQMLEQPVRCFFRPLAGPIYRYGWDRMLELPPDFGAILADKVGQEMELRNGIGENWPVVLSLYDGTVSLRRGWENFIDRHELKERDLLVFRNNGSHFKVEVYNGSTLCERTLANRPPSVVRFFKLLISDSWLDRLVLPDSISGILEDKVGQQTKLENALGENWMVTLSSARHGNVAFERGWEIFSRHHNLEVGDMLVFRGFNRGSLFEVEVYDGKTFCEKACRMSLIRPVPVYGDAGGNIASSSVPLRANIGSPPHRRHVREHTDAKRNTASSSVPPSANFGSPPVRDTVSNAVPPCGRHVQEHCYAKRKLASSTVPLRVNFGSPPHGSHVREHGYKKINLDKRAVSNYTRSPPQETSNETESPDDPLPCQETVTCRAVTSGGHLVLPIGLPVVQGLNRKPHSSQKSILLMDEGSRFWPASLYTRARILSCAWGVFAAANGVQDGDRYSFTAVDQFTFKIDILRSARWRA